MIRHGKNMAKYYNEDTVIWQNKNLIPASRAKIDLYSQTMHYGYGVFEGIRSYQTEAGMPAIFKEDEHFTRLRHSAEALNLPYTWTNAELIEASYEVLKQNKLTNAYIRPLVYAPANMSFEPNTESFAVIEAWEMAPFLGEKLLKVGISEFQRPNPKAFPIHAKACGHYVNSILASQQARREGFDEALLLDMNGHVAEAPGANFFMEKNGRLLTPAAGHILSGITRQTVLEICRELNIEVEETTISPEEAIEAESAFFCGTAAEVIGIESINGKKLKRNWNESPGHAIADAYNRLVRKKS